MTSILPTVAPSQVERLERPDPAARAAASAPAADVGSFDAALDAAAPFATGATYQHSRSGLLDPIARFESFVLGSFVETMLPKDDSGYFGGGTAGNMWRSMLAERIGEELARSGGVGIADMIRERKTPSAGG